MPDILIKKAAEVRAYVWDFTNRREVESGETLSAPTVAVSPAGPTLSAAAVLVAAFDGVAIGKGVKATVSGGTAATDYTITCTVTTSGGATLLGVGTLSVN